MRGNPIGKRALFRNRRHASYEMDMTEGSLWKKIILYALPLMATGILQLLFNAADIIVVGRFAGNESLAAVTSTSSLINLVVNLFIGLSVGASVSVAMHYGAHKDRDVSETVHTAICLALIGGVLLGIVGFVLAKRLLAMMGSPDGVIDKAALYLRIYFAGLPAMMLYNFAAAILRAVGDTRRPMYYLLIAGVLNALMNLFFVIVLRMDVAGVALATVLSQCVSMGLVLACLIRSAGSIRLRPREVRIVPAKLRQILRVGLPAGIQSTIFSISNVIIQSSINSFGATVMAGSGVAQNVEGFVYTAMNALYQAALAFSGQNYGAAKYRRIGKTAVVCLVYVLVIGQTLGLAAYASGKALLSIYNQDPEVIAMGVTRLRYVCALYGICGLMDVLCGVLRGIGYAVMPMLVSIFGVCGIRIGWIFTVFAQSRTLPSLFVSYPVSWTATGLIHAVCLAVFYRRLLAREERLQPAGGDPRQSLQKTDAGGDAAERRET